MKKLLSFFAIAAMLLVVSCNKPQEFLGDEGDLASIHFSVMGELMTKANSDFATGTKVDKLAVQAFILGSDEAYHLTNANITITPVTGASPLAWDVDMKLAKNRAYKIAFFAYKDGTGIYGVENLSAITVDYSKIAINSDDADAFSAARSLTVTGALSETVELYRPLAQLNIGVSDWEEYKNSTLEEMQDITVAISVNSVPNGLNLIGGETADDGSVAATVSGENTVEFARVDVLDVDDELVTGYDYFAMVYVLASKDKENMTFTADFEFGDETSVDISNIEITNMPFQANYRTNVLGQLLTGNIHYDVEIVPGFMTPDYEKLLAPEFESVAALNDYFATMADNSDDGDVEPEVVSISAAADGDVIKLPKIAGGVVIRVNAVCDGTLTVQYADGASDTQKPANVYLYVKKATNLVVNLPASHVELIDDSWVTGTVTATTSGDTFVVSKKAKVGKVEIKQGNTEIAGAVNNVEVAAGASADGAGAPVQVFLSKDAAVEQIELNAKADVVVEQPADNVDNGSTDNKVKVVVKEAAEGSTATAQNGGAIYVEAEADCTVEASGDASAYVAKAEDGDGNPVEVTAVGDKVEASDDAEDSLKVIVAVVDGVSFETMDAALAAAESAQDKTVYVMAGEFDIVFGNVPAGVAIEGKGESATTLKSNGINLAKDITITKVTLLNTSNSDTAVAIRGGIVTLDYVALKRGSGSFTFGIFFTGSTAGNVTLKHITFATPAFRNVMLEGNGTVLIEDTDLSGNGYTLSTYYDTGKCDVTVNRCKLYGWTSYNNGEHQFTFNDCEFGKATYVKMRPYSPTVFNRCSFTADFAGNVDPIKCRIDLNECTFDGVAVTLENVAPLLNVRGQTETIFVNEQQFNPAE